MTGEIPFWFYKGIALIVIWLIGQIVTEKIKLLMRKEVIKAEWTVEERRQTIVIDDELLGKFLGAYRDHIQVVENLLESSRTKNDVLVELGKQLKEHMEMAEDTRDKIKKIFNKVVNA